MVESKSSRRYTQGKYAVWGRVRMSGMRYGPNRAGSDTEGEVGCRIALGEPGRVRDIAARESSRMQMHPGAAQCNEEDGE